MEGKYKCSSCKTDSSGRFFRCDLCFNYQHEHCTKLSEIEKQVMSDINRKLQYICTTCNIIKTRDEPDDMAEIEFRACNLILYGVPEFRKKKEQAYLAKHEKFAVNRILSSCGVRENIMPFHVSRLGKPNLETEIDRPLLLNFRNQEEASEVYALRQNLDEPFRLKPDRTIKERKLLKSMYK